MNQVPARVENPFPATAAPQAGGAVAVEQQRAVAEALAAMQVARAYPRDPRKAVDLVLNDCSMPALAEDAVYEYARGGSDVSGPSIRLAEAIARRWGNISTGVKELARREGYSEVMAYAVDLETGYRDEKLFQVRHWRDTKQGGYALKDERDLYETIANSGARRKRACILAIIPQDVIDAAVRQCEVTLKTKMEITPDFINSLVQSFAAIGVTVEMLEKNIQRRIDTLTPALAIKLRRIRTSIKDGMSTPAEWFEMPGAAVPGGTEAPPQSASARMAEELASKAKTQAPVITGANAVKTADPETGEITNASVRKAIADATTQDQLTKIMMGDLMKLPANEDRAETMRLWNARVVELKPKEAPAPAGTTDVAPAATSPAPAKAKPHGAERIKVAIKRKMAAAKTLEKLNEAYDERTLYAWDEKDAKELEARYNECKTDLALGS